MSEMYDMIRCRLTHQGPSQTAVFFWWKKNTKDQFKGRQLKC